MVQKTGRRVTFIFTPGSKISNAFLVGSFNNWSTAADPMQRMSDGTFRKSKRMDPGRHEYKFYADGLYWNDAEAEAQILNNYGTLNSLVTVNGQ
jgi:hypothetical protein